MSGKSAKYIRVASDLHLETRNQEIDLLPPDERDKDSILVLAGDISNDKDQVYDFITKSQPRFYAVVYVPGNHEFFGHEMDEWVTTMDDRLADNCLVYAALAEARSFVISNVRFVCGTMWGDGCTNAYEAWQLERMVNDFSHIKEWSHDTMVAVNAEHRDQISRFLKEPFIGKTVVVTHHLPSHALCAVRFGYKLNGAFACDCDDLMHGPHAPSLWLHGHSHDTNDRIFGNTRVVCNPAGYPGDAHSGYNHYDKMFIDIC